LSQQLCKRVDKPGMIAAFEFMAVTSAIANLIRENKTYRIDSAIQIGKKYGMQLLDDHLMYLFQTGKIGRDELLDKARHAGEVQDQLDKMNPGQSAAGPAAGLATG
ncbi:MAG: hypothetical protein PHU85_09170, partial [Phycisphaerae bacterium]|nr:hypothetical protein [Phycisphaerae bacterium]